MIRLILIRINSQDKYVVMKLRILIAILAIVWNQQNFAEARAFTRIKKDSALMRLKKQCNFGCGPAPDRNAGMATGYRYSPMRQRICIRKYKL